MAGDWIKMRCDLDEDPAVIAIAAATGLAEDHVIGKLWKFWRWANRQLRDGFARGLTTEWLDRYLGTKGFADAMLQAQWLRLRTDGLEIPNFDHHNGASAKKRLSTSERVQRHREKKKCNADVAPKSLAKVIIPRSLRRHVLQRDDHTCVYCGWNMPPSRKAKWREDLLSLDHVVPESRGGLTEAGNLATACVRCNLAKADRPPDEAGLFLTHLTAKAAAELVTLERYKSVTREEKRREEKTGEVSPDPSTQPDKPAANAKKPRPRNELFDAIVKVTGADPSVNGKHIGSVCATLQKAEPPYTPADVFALPGAIAASGLPIPAVTPGVVEKWIYLVRTPPVRPSSARPKPSGQLDFSGQHDFVQRGKGTSAHDAS